jgi:hypothetical protein
MPNWDWERQMDYFLFKTTGRDEEISVGCQIDS